jgi:glycine cleavage system H protein
MSDTSNVPAELRYTKDHEWVRVDGDIAVIGITAHAQGALGEITYTDLPEPGLELAQGDELAAVESSKAAVDVYAPISGTVAEINEALEDAPEKTNESPYGDGWLCKLSGFDAAQLDGLMDAAAYKAMLEQEDA